MNLKRLRYFYEIANEGQITRAAKKLHIAQPPLSQALKALENSLDVILFERNRRQMELTDAGAVLYEKAKTIFNYIDDTIIEVKETGRGVRGSLAIGCNKSCFSHLPHKITHYRDKYPQVTFKLFEGDSYRLSKQLIEREIEIAIVRLPIEMNHFSYYKLPNEEYVAVVSNHWINQRNKINITLQELTHIPLLLLHRIRGIGQYELILERFRNKNLTPKIICESPNIDMLLALVNEGLGATIIPKSTLLKHNTSHVYVLPIKDTHIVSKSAIIWLKECYLSKSALNFIQLFKDKDKNNLPI